MNCCVYNSPCRTWVSCNFWCPASECPCGPKRELVMNGGFELDICNGNVNSAGWHSMGCVSSQDQFSDTGHNAHQGTGAVALGLSPDGQGGDGCIWQIIKRGICPGSAYQFSFFMSPHSFAEKFRTSSSNPDEGYLGPSSLIPYSGYYGNGQVNATITFLDRYCNELLSGQQEILIPMDTLAIANVWTYYKTIAVAPACAWGACIKLRICDPSWNWREHVHIDDVSLVAL